MKLASIREGDRFVPVIATGSDLIRLSAASKVIPCESQIPDTVDGIIAAGPELLRSLRQYADKLSDAGDAEKAQFTVRAEDAEWGPCVTNPQKIICIGLNYRKHAEETKAPIPETPVVFGKFNNALTGHLTGVAIPEGTQQMDYEVELAIVIGRSAENVGRESALDCVFGYAVANDLSARDWQLRTSQWLLGKTGNHFCPLGPYLVTADEVPNPNALALRLTVNGEQRQSSNTSDMIFYCDEIISYLSKHMTLMPGDIILTGTPEGVVLGLPRETRKYLKPGDVVIAEIEGLGSLTSRMSAPASR